MSANTNKRIEALVSIMRSLRHKDSGCPWDLKQNFKSIAPYTLEEAYEVFAAIEEGDMMQLRDELGDLLFHVVFHAQIAEEEKHFNFDDVVEGICNKLTQRHPHVFSKEKVNKQYLEKNWEAQKRLEKKTDKILDGISPALPVSTQAFKLQKKAASVGFDWQDIKPVIEKLEEEVRELKDEIDKKNNQERIEQELGDVLFSCINLARHLNVSADWALMGANQRFYKRFNFIEEYLKDEQMSFENCSLERLNELWGEAKKSLEQ